jgi:hypothetical protein
VKVRELLLIANAVWLLLHGRPGDEVVAELREWGGPSQATYGSVAILFLVAALGLAFLESPGRSSVLPSREMPRISMAR